MTLLSPVLDPNNFSNSTQITNPDFPLIPGETYVYESEDGSKVGYFAVTHKTINILGVTWVVVEHTEYEDGELTEKTKDYHAQDDFGNVWYGGEDVKQYENGKVVGTEGTWRAGVDGAQAGFFVLAPPSTVGDMYFQEIADNAQDFVEVVDLNADPAAVAAIEVQPGAAIPYGQFNSAMEHKETTALEPGALASKYYVAGVGMVLDVNRAAGVDPGDNVEMLVKMIIDGTNKSETLMGRAGTDELNGLNGNDTMDGGAGSDTLDGGKGNDDVTVGTGDHADGGAGYDVLNLADNSGFGSIDGGDQKVDDLAKSGGDILNFNGHLDLTAAGISERIIDVETLSMKDGSGGDKVTLAADDIFDFDGGDFDPKGNAYDEGLAVRVDGDSGDVLELDGGTWSQISPANAPLGYDVWTSEVGVLGVAYVLVQEAVTVDLI